MEAMNESMIDSGVIRYPDELSGFCRAPDYGLLRLIPTRRDLPNENAERIPRWLRQRRGGDAPSVKTYQSPGAAPSGSGPPAQGAWPHGITPSLWELATTHNANWQCLVVFKGRLVTRLRIASVVMALL
eukprot:2521224-Pyramimonas_sp.AAC.2